MFSRKPIVVKDGQLRLKAALLFAGGTLFSGFATPAVATQIASFTANDLIISTVTGSTLDSASPITLQEFQLGANGTQATSVGTFTLPQTSSGSNAAISGEYGSASEGILQRSVDGRYLTIMGYGVNAAAFNTAPVSTYGTAALGQTTSLTAAQQSGTAYTTVPRVVALIGANGSVDTSTALTGVFNTNNPRSATTVDGSSFYVSGQAASKTDSTQGVFYAKRGATTATAVDTSTDTRVVSIVNTGSGNTLYVSRDYNPPGSGKQNNTNVSSLTSSTGGLPTSSTGLVSTHVTPPASPLSSGGNNGSINLTAALANGVNNSRIGSFVYLSPEQFFFASPTVLYVADSGQPKNGNANKAALGEGGLQKWVLVNGIWTLAYDLVSGLTLVNNANANASTPTAPGVTGLFGLTGEVVDGEVELFATSYGLNELSSSYLYEITDVLSDTTAQQASGEKFTTLYAAPAGTSIRGVAFAPVDVPEPSSLALVMAALGGLTLLRRRQV
ncbi:PEP-CTERM sorting domain-containing protein [Telmatospirillum sp.]|uniref:PEP-CTERM sorting domain-containing protein n=1 Tax=Telmatospirillum sp. TaxID=2079197 RepID=UPI002850A674|nr:PEP-CTERM sorting domain-containing protein [Telmatospirillum sp.]MDR3439634.1 PEP-CTERM sorting domain-containing protein [Telmatospirillum sp.]